jgi:hypothetical protein
MFLFVLDTYEIEEQCLRMDDTNFNLRESFFSVLEHSHFVFEVQQFATFLTANLLHFNKSKKFHIGFEKKLQQCVYICSIPGNKIS